MPQTNRPAFAECWLLRFPEIQKELELSDQQISKIQELQKHNNDSSNAFRKKQDESYRNVFGSAAEIKAARDKLLAEYRQFAVELSNDEREELSAILLNKQFERLQELVFQAKGSRVFFEELHSEKLGISAHQVDQIRAFIKKRNDRMSDNSKEYVQKRSNLLRLAKEAFKNEDFDREDELKAELDQLRENSQRVAIEARRQFWEDVRANVLNESQNRKFDRLRGKEFEFQSSELISASNE